MHMTWFMNRNSLLLKTLYAPNTAAKATAKGTHSFFMMAVPTMSRPAGMYTPLTYWDDISPDIIVRCIMCEGGLECDA
jgi:hypothetical protein